MLFCLPEPSGNLYQHSHLAAKQEKWLLNFAYTAPLFMHVGFFNML
jgi:hypothetical protein